MDIYGNITAIEDHARLAYNFEKIYQQNRENILGELIDELGEYAEDSVEHMALCEGVRALMETRRS